MQAAPTISSEKLDVFSAEDLAELSRWRGIAERFRYHLVHGSDPETGEITPICRAENGGEFILIELCEPHWGINPGFAIMRAEGRWIVEDRLCEVMRSHASVREALESIFRTF
jgi:hypothetical protein